MRDVNTFLVLWALHLRKALPAAPKAFSIMLGCSLLRKSDPSLAVWLTVGEWMFLQSTEEGGISKMSKFQKEFRSLSDETVTKASLGSQYLNSVIPLSCLFMAVEKELE